METFNDGEVVGEADGNFDDGEVFWVELILLIGYIIDMLEMFRCTRAPVCFTHVTPKLFNMFCTC